LQTSSVNSYRVLYAGPRHPQEQAVAPLQCSLPFATLPITLLPLQSQVTGLVVWVSILDFPEYDVESPATPFPARKKVKIKQVITEKIALPRIIYSFVLCVSNYIPS
jgi:hypothetical protein